MASHETEYEELLDKRDSLDSDDTESPGCEYSGPPPSPSKSKVQVPRVPIYQAQANAKKTRWLLFSRGRKSNSHNGTHIDGERVPPLLFWLAAAVAIVAFTDLAALAYIARMFDTVFQDRDFASHLEYANPYIGLKELYASGRINASHIDPILIRPRISAQVFFNSPDKLAPRGEHDYWSETWGMLSPNERHLHVTQNIHTVVQYRAIDFGMEDCRLVFMLPKLGAPLEDHASFVMRPSSRFDVFRLAAEQPVDVKKLSYRTRPPVAERVAMGLQAQADGETLIHRFPCPWSSLHVFEIACAEGSECLLDVWSSQNTTYGVNIYQHQTI